MAVRFDRGTNEYLSRTSGLVDYNGAYSVCFWGRLSVDTNAYQHFIALSYDTNPNSGVAWHNSDFIGTDADGTTVRAGSVVGASGDFQTGASLSVGTWYHMALVRESATVLKMYMNGALAITMTANVASRTAIASEYMGQFNTLPLDGRIAAYKQWTVALTADEIKNEMHTYLPKRYAGIHRWTPMLAGATERLRDYAGVARNWTATGTLTDEDGPPISWGGVSLHNLVLATAGSIAYSLTCNAGSYALNGQAVELLRSLRLAAEHGSYALNGQSTSLLHARFLGAAQGAYVITGQAAELRAARMVQAAAGSYSLNGQSISLVRSLTLTPETGAYALNGQSTELVRGTSIAAAHGSYSIAGQSVALNIARKLVAASGTYAVSGQAVDLVSSAVRVIECGQGVYALSGQAIVMTAARKLTPASGSYTLNGQAVVLLASGMGGTIICLPGSYTIAGGTLRMRWIVLEPTRYALLDELATRFGSDYLQQVTDREGEE